MFGVSTDSVKAQQAFQQRHNLPFRLIADTNGEMIKAFSVPLNLGKFASRQSFLIKDDIIIWRDLKVKPNNQVLDSLQTYLPT